MKLNIPYFKILCLTLFAAALSLQSCGDDDVEGCTDASSENYNVEATIDDGSCIYARDKFIGDFVCEFLCPGPLAFISNDTLIITISPSLDEMNKSEVIFSLEVSGVSVGLLGTVEGDSLFIDDTLMDVIIPHPTFGPLTADIIGTGNAVMVDNDTRLVGNVGLTANTALIPIPLTDNCTVEGDKQ
ncbi:MAG: hypothetical protein HKN09_05790 [Saprospiraceae bacterium]|nr:hypothetical protein [Saprospiraceae bacterium]